MLAEATIRVWSFLVILIVMGVAETRWPRRVLDTPKGRRWFANLSMAALSTVSVRLLIPIIPTGAAVFCADNGLGLFNLLPVSPMLAIPASILLLDMAIYWQHVAFHRIPILWRIHRMHHADVNIDASTGVRFHPIEIGLSALIKLAAIAIIGPPPEAVIAFEIILNGCALFNHANLHLPSAIDSALRLAIVTPDMHRIHHSTDVREFNMNYGFNFPWWDRMFGTYKAQPDLGHTGMRIGLNLFRDPAFNRLGRMLSIPFI